MSHLTDEILERLLDGDLSGAEAAAAEAHLAACAACAARRAALATLFSELAALVPEPPPFDLAPTVLARVAPPPRWDARAWALLFAQALLTVALGLLLAPAFSVAAAAVGSAIGPLTPPFPALPAWAAEPRWIWAQLDAAAALVARSPLALIGGVEWTLLLGCAFVVWLGLNGYLLRRRATPDAEREVRP